MKSSEILKLAREALWKGDESYTESGNTRNSEYICLVVSEVCKLNGLGYTCSTSESIRNTVKLKLNACTFTDYLRNIHGEAAVMVMTSREVQTLRLQLIDDLITEYEEKGE